MSDVENIYAYILENPGCRNREISAALKIPMGTVNATVHTLRKQGNVKPAVVDSHSPSFGRCWAEDLAPSLEPSPAPHPGAVPADTGEAGGGDGVDVPPLPTEPDSPTATLDALRAARELAEENAALKGQIAGLAGEVDRQRGRAKAAEWQLHELGWLCGAMGIPGISYQGLELLPWLLERLGRSDLATAVLVRRKLQAEIRERETALRDLAEQVRAELPPETDDRCKCGNEARKLEGEDGFTTCDDCYQDGEE